MRKNNGYLLMEALVSIFITLIIMGTALLLMRNSNKNWHSGENNFDIAFNYRHTNVKLVDEIRNSCAIEILDFSDTGWIKIYKSLDKSSFVTFRLKNSKLFIGYNNTLNSNSELCNYIEKFRLEYLPLGVTDPDYATGVNIYLEFKKGNHNFSSNTAVALRY